MNDITTEADTGISVGKDESDTMSMRNKIAEIVSEADCSDDRGYGPAVINPDAIADAILAALPDMIAPLVWEGPFPFDGHRHGKWRSGEYTAMRDDNYYAASLSGYFINNCKLYDSPAEAKAAADTHHRAAIMAAFTGETE
jgi:hypothetical protein